MLGNLFFCIEKLTFISYQTSAMNTLGTVFYMCMQLGLVGGYFAKDIPR